MCELLQNDRSEARVVSQLLEVSGGEMPSPELAEQLFELDVRNPARLVSLPMSLEALVSQQPTWNGPLNRFRVQAAWKLCQWGNLDDALAQVGALEFALCLGIIRVAFS